MQDEPDFTCPYCDHPYTDAWDFFTSDSSSSERLIDCENCEKEFFLYQEVSVDYSTGVKK